MNYTHLIDPELKSIAKRVPYNKCMIKIANIYQMLELFDGFLCGSASVLYFDTKEIKGSSSKTEGISLILDDLTEVNKGYWQKLR